MDVTCPLRPLRDKVVLLKPTPTERVLDSGLLIPTTADQSSQEGTILAVGVDVEAVVVGDGIVHANYCGVDFTHDGTTYMIINETDILARINDKKEKTI